VNSSLSVVLVHRNEHERALLRQAFEALSGVSIAGERSDLRSGMAMARQVRPAILVLDLNGPTDDSLTVASQYRMENPEVAIFISTDAYDSDTLVRAMRAGAQEVLRRPLDRSALTAAVERVAALTARKLGTKSSNQVISVFSTKGGSGVTTIAANLALALRRQTRRSVALADLDYQSGDASFVLGLAPVRSLGDLIALPRLDSASVQDAMIKHESGVAVMSQPEHIDRVEGLDGQIVGNVLEIISATNELVVVDAPHIFNEVALELFDRSSTILLVCGLSVPSVRSARRALDIFHKLNYLAVPDRVRLVINRFSDDGAISMAQVVDTLGLEVFATIANDYVAVSEAINLGAPLCAMEPTSRAGKDIDRLARLLVPSATAHAADIQAPRRKLRLFGKG
jgi:pilus assembly protein CpaE